MLETPLSRSIQQLRDMTYDDGTHVFASVHLAPLHKVSEEMLPCAIFTVEPGGSLDVLCLLPCKDDRAQTEFQAMALWDILWKHLRVRAGMGMVQYQGVFYRAVRFSERMSHEVG